MDNFPRDYDKKALTSALSRFHGAFCEVFDLNKQSMLFCDGSVIASSPSIVSSQDAARLIGLAPKTLENWRTKGLGPKFVKIGSRVAYRSAEIESWLEATEAQNAARLGRGA